MRTAALLLLLLVPPLLLAVGEPPMERGPRALAAQAMRAYEHRDMPLFINKMKQALALRPTHQTYLYNLATGYALSGDVRAAKVQREQAGMRADRTG